MERKVDIRTIRTKNVIKNEILDFIEKEKEISIQAITKSCSINRNTFYIHFKNINEAIDEIKNDIADEVVNSLVDYSIEELNVNPSLFIDAIYKVILTNPKYTKVFFDKKYENHYNGILRHKISDHFLNKCKDTEFDLRMVKTSIEFFVSGLFYSIYDWYQEEDNESIEELTDRISEIVTKRIHYQ